MVGKSRSEGRTHILSFQPCCLSFGGGRGMLVLLVLLGLTGPPKSAYSTSVSDDRDILQCK